MRIRSPGLRPHPLIWGTGLIVTLVACGTRVDVGHNDQPPRQEPQGQELEGGTSGDDPFADQGDEPGAEEGGSEGETAGGEKQGADSPGTTSGTWSLDTASSRGCFSVPATLPTELADVCKTLLAENPQPFEKAVTMICKERKFVNFLQAKCGWRGQGPSSRFTFKLKEDRAPSSKEYYFMSATVTTVPESVDHFLEWNRKLYGDYDAFLREGYTGLKTVVTRNPAGDMFGEGLTYDFSMNRGAPFSFRGRMKAYKPTANVAVLINDADSNFSSNMRLFKQFLLLFTPSKGPGVVIALEEKGVHDGGQHELATETTRTLNHEKMEALIKNASLRK